MAASFRDGPDCAVSVSWRVHRADVLDAAAPAGSVSCVHTGEHASSSAVLERALEESFKIGNGVPDGTGITRGRSGDFVVAA